MSNSFYASPSYMSGGYLPIYAGARRHRGGGFLGSIRKFMAPVGRHMLSGVKSFAKNKTVQSIGKKALQKGMEVAANVAVDALQGRNVGESIKQHSRESALNSILGPSESMPKKPASAKLKQRKRKASSNAPQRKSQSKGKRRRKTVSRRSALKRKQLF